jgi:hypothetical protein
MGMLRAVIDPLKLARLAALGNDAACKRALLALT